MGDDSPETYRVLLENLLSTVRDMLSDDALPEDEVRVFMESQMFKELCPELSDDYDRVRQYEDTVMAKSKEKRSKSPSHGHSSLKTKKDVGDHHERGKSKEGKHGDGSRKESHHDKEKKSHHHHHHRHKEDGKGSSKDKGEERVKVKAEPVEKPKSIRIIEMTSSSSFSSSGSDRNRVTKKKKLIKKSSRIRSSSSSSSDSDRNMKKDAIVKVKKDASESKYLNQEGEKNKTGDGGPPKVHPYWLAKNAIEVKGKLFENDLQDSISKSQKEKERQREKEKEKERQRQKEKERQWKRQQEEIRRRREKEKEKQLARLTKPYTYYNSWQSKTRVRESTWKPHQEPEYKKFEKNLKLMPLSIVCVDLSNLKKYFHTSSNHPPPPTSCASSILLKKNNIMIIPDSKGDEIENTEKTKRESFAPVLNKWFTRNVVGRKRAAGDDSNSDSDYERANQKKKKSNRNNAFQSSSESSSDPIHPLKRDPNKDTRNDKFSARKGTAEYKAELRKKQLEEVRQKAERKIAEKGTRKLPWENNEYFDKNKKAAQDNAKKENVKSGKDKSKSKLNDRIKNMRKAHAPALPFQRILASIEAANKEAAKKPPVLLKIPKLSERPNTTEYARPSKQISPGEVANEVSKLLRSTSKVEMPNMPSSHYDLADYTVRKIAWWFLKSEKDPADEVALHPELHDNEIYEEWFDPCKDRSDDESSIGCVSDPEGTEKYDEEELRKKALDPDWADEYCGLQTLEARFRKQGANPADRNQDIMKGFFKIRPDTNYEKPNFEAKCFLCDEKIFGQRQLGAHIRSDQHKNQFRNYSLQMANYDEKRVPVVSKKVFNAKLVTYTVDNQIQTEKEVEDDKDKYQACHLDMEKADSPRAVIDGEDNSPELVGVHEIPADELSLPSISKFDLSVDNCQKEAKITLRTNNLWTKEMEDRWMKATELETRLTNEYNDKRELYINEPDSHPLMSEEWNRFYNDRCAEVEAEGNNPDELNLVSEWMPYWLKRLQEIMKNEAEYKVLQMKKSLGVDFESLNKILQRNNLEIKTESMPRTPATKYSSKSSGKALLHPAPQVGGKSYERKVQETSALHVTKKPDSDIQIIPSVKINKGNTPVTYKHGIGSKSSAEPGEIDSISSVSFGLDQNKLTSFITVDPTSELRKSIDELAASNCKTNETSKTAANMSLMSLPDTLNKNSLGYHLLTQPQREAGEIIEVDAGSSSRQRTEPEKRYERWRPSEEKDRNNRHRDRYSPPPRKMNKKARRRERERDRRWQDDEKHNNSTGLSSGYKWRPAPGPRCSKPIWMNDSRDSHHQTGMNANREFQYQANPSNRPPTRDDWAEDSWG